MDDTPKAVQNPEGVESNRTFYDAESASYDQRRLENPYKRYVNDRERAYLRRTLTGGTLLEVGAGTGRLTDVMVERVDRLVATDLSAGMLAQLKAKVAAPTLQVVEIDVFRLPDLPDYGRFDWVVCMRVLPHLERYAEALRILHDALAPGGQAIFDFWSAHSYTYYRKAKRHRKKKKTSGLYTHFVPGLAVAREIAAAGFGIEEWWSWGFPTPLGLRLEWLGRCPGIKRLGYSLIFRGRRAAAGASPGAAAS